MLRRGVVIGMPSVRGSENRDGSSSSRNVIGRTLVCGLWRLGPLPSSLICRTFCIRDPKTEGRYMSSLTRDSRNNFLAKSEAS